MNLSKLEATSDELAQTIAEAQNNISAAVEKHQTTGEYADRMWFGQQKAIVRNKTVVLHNVNRQIKRIKASINRDTGRAVAFYKIAQKVLPIKNLSEIEELVDAND